MPPRLRPLLSLTVVCALLSPQAAAGAVPPSYTMEERAAAIASPSLVYIEAHLDGFLRGKADKKRLHDSPITVVTRCSGFAVGEAGHAVTATRCLQPSPGALRGSASYTLANMMIRDGKLAADRKDAYTRQLIDTAEFVGADGGQRIEPRIFAQLFRAFGGLTTVPAVPGRIVDSRPSTAADVALLKFEADLPVAELSPDDLNPDAPVVLVGFGTSDTVLEAASYTMRSRAVRVTGSYEPKPNMRRLDGDVGAHSHGGMAVDEAGRVVGMINTDTAGQEDTNRVVAELATVRELMTAAGVANELAAGDQTYRAGLDAYFAGRYPEAVEKLGAVVTASPGHVTAKHYRDLATERLALEEADSGLPTWALILIIGLVAALLALAVLTAVLVVRHRRRAAAALTLYDYSPISGVPVSAYPISGGGYDGPTEYPALWRPPAAITADESSPTSPPQGRDHP